MNRIITYAPVELTIYDADDQPVKTLSKTIIRWGVLKQAIKIAVSMQGDEGVFAENTISLLTAFICHVFDDKVTPQEVDEGTDIGEIMTIFKTIMNRANQLGNA